MGLGFNIKMLQAFLPLPALYALYFFGTSKPWRQKIIQLGVTTVLLLTVSLLWAIIVDLTPASARPYVGGSQRNSVVELMIGYNGINRLLGMQRNASGAPPAGITDSSSYHPNQSPDNPPYPPFAQPPPGVGGGPPFPPASRPSDDIFAQEIGTPSAIRLFVPPLAKELSWLLPFGLVCLIGLTITAHPSRPLAAEHQAVILWGGWLLIGLVFFSVANFFHDYYLIMLAAPLAAVIGSGVAVWWRKREQGWVQWTLALAAAGTLAFQWWLARQYGQDAWWLRLAAIGLASGLIALLMGRWWLRQMAFVAAYAFLVVAMLITPLAWSVLTVAKQNPDVALPGAYGGSQFGTDLSAPAEAPAFPNQHPPDQAANPSTLLAFLQAHT